MEPTPWYIWILIYRAGHEVPRVVAVLSESLGMGGYREGDMPRMGLSVPFAYHPCTSVQKLKKQKQTKQRTIDSEPI